MLRVVQHFDKDCSCHLQGEVILVGHFGSVMWCMEWAGHWMWWILLVDHKRGLISH